jgi:hypothetical protein
VTPNEDSVTVAVRSDTNVNTRGVPIIACREDSVLSTGLYSPGAPMSRTMGPHVHPRRERMDSAVDMGVELGCALVESPAGNAPPATPWVI